MIARSSLPLFALVVAGLFGLATWQPLEAADSVSDETIGMIVELLADPDPQMRGLALQQVREALPGEEATKRFAGLLPKLDATGQAALIDALAVRRDPAALTAIEQLARSENPNVRAAVVRAIGSLGGVAAVPRLVETLQSSDPAAVEAAKSALIRMAAPEVTRLLIDALERGPATVRPAVISVLVERNAYDCSSSLLKWASDSDRATRDAALNALSRLAGPADVPALVSLLLKAETPTAREDLEKTIMFACRRGKQAEPDTDKLIRTFRELNPTEKTLVLPALGRVGGPEALAAVEEAFASADEALREAGFRALCNWPDASVAPRLLDLAKRGPTPQHRISALRALMRVAVLPDNRTPSQRLDLLKQAVALATRDEEIRLAIDRAKAVRSIDSLRFVVGYLDNPSFTQQACATICELAHHKELREPNKAEFDAALDKVISLAKDPKLVDRAERYKAGRTIEK